MSGKCGQHALGYEHSGNSQTSPQAPGFLGHEPDVLRALLHLAGKIQCSGHDEEGIGSPDLDLGVESFDVDLGGGHGLLPRV